MVQDPSLVSDKLLFRMKHIVPQNLSLPSGASNKGGENSVVGPEEVEFPMTWGKVAAKIWGPADGQPVFAVHGWLDNAGTFDALIPLLPKNLRIVAVDTAGHGLSSHFPPDIAYNYLDCLLAFERLANILKWEKFWILGHSIGGSMAMMYAGIFPNRVEKFISLDLVRIQPTIPETVDIRLRKTVGKLLKYEAEILAGPEKPISYETAIEKSITGSFGSLDEKACHIMFKRGLKKVEGGYVFSRDRRLLAAPLSFGPKKDQLILASKVTADVLVIIFTEGPYFESKEEHLEHMEALKTKSKCVRYVEIEGKHHTHLTNPERIAPIISDFFKV